MESGYAIRTKGFATSEPRVAIEASDVGASFHTLSLKLGDSLKDNQTTV
jgi:hypothetical protein